MSKTYTVVLNSQNTTNLDTTGTIIAYTYKINWHNILPFGVDKFDLTTTFKSRPTTAEMLETIMLSVNLGSTLVADQNTYSSSFLCSIIPKSFQGTAINYYYESNVIDDSSVTVSYPSNDFITVFIKKLDGSAVSTVGFPNYILSLTFTPI